jgi:deoxyribonuclease-4
VPRSGTSRAADAPRARRQAPPRLGAHTSIAGGLHLALERGAAAGCEVVQIFTRSNQQWAARPLRDDEVALWHETRARTGVVPALVHSCYLLNLAAPAAALRDRSIEALADELVRADRLAIPYLVLHPGAHMGDGEAAGIARIANGIDRAFAAAGDARTKLLLENTAGQGTCLGNRFEHLRDILAAVAEPDRIGVCLDTCHALAAGYELTSDDGYAAAIDALRRCVGAARVRACHLNDSKQPLGSRVDRHEHIGRGCLGLSPFQRLLNDRRFAGLPMVLETPKPTDAADRQNLAVLRALAGRRRVTPRARELARVAIG